MFYIVLLLLLLIILFSIFFIILERDIFAPTIVMIIMFFLSCFIALLNAENWKIEYNFKAFFLIGSGIFVFGISETIISKYAKTKINSKKVEKEKRVIRIENWKIIFTIIMNFFILLLYFEGMKSIVLESGYSLHNMSFYYRKITSYDASAHMSMWILMLIKFLDASTYICLYIFVNNVIVSREKGFTNVILLIPMIIFCLKTLMSGGRLDILKIIFFAVVASYILYQQKVGWKIKTSFKYIFIGITMFMIMIPLFYYALELTGRNSTRSLTEVISTYIGGSIQHFNQFVQSPIEKNKIWGKESFVPILNLMGKYNLIDYHNVVHLEFRHLGETIGNVYTFFRRPLQDFGVLGMYIFTLLVSTFFSFFYYFRIKRERIGYEQDKKNIIYSYIFYWIILSSIEQYSVTIISVYTILALLFLKIMGFFYFRLHISKSKIYFKRAADWSNR